jgi:hypothetical protein
MKFLAFVSLVASVSWGQTFHSNNVQGLEVFKADKSGATTSIYDSLDGVVGTVDCTTPWGSIFVESNGQSFRFDSKEKCHEFLEHTTAISKKEITKILVTIDLYTQKVLDVHIYPTVPRR